MKIHVSTDTTEKSIKALKDLYLSGIIPISVYSASLDRIVGKPCDEIVLEVYKATKKDSDKLVAQIMMYNEFPYRIWMEED